MKRFQGAGAIRDPGQRAMTGIPQLPVKEGLRGMKPGGTRVLVVPPELGFGEAGMAKQVPPNSTLTILLEVFGVKPPPSPREVQN